MHVQQLQVLQQKATHKDLHGQHSDRVPATHPLLQPEPKMVVLQGIAGVGACDADRLSLVGGARLVLLLV